MSKIRQRLEARQPLWVNWYVDEYIGGGASSEVYKLSERRFGQVSVVKVISWNSKNMPSFSTSATYNTLKEYRSRAESEIRAMYELQNCPYIVHCKNHDFWDYYDEDMNLIGFDVLIQMDYWSCFQERLLDNEQNTDEREILKFAKNITCALIAAHSKGIIHRDIKPENVFIDNSGNYLLGDFGVSKQAENNLLSTTTGTKPFMAPEIFNRKKYDKTVDIYSLGIVLYMLLNNNRLPFVTEVMSFNEVQDAVYDRMSGKPLTPPENGSDEFRRIILKCCEFRAEDRYASAQELLDDLNRLDIMENGYGEPYAKGGAAPTAKPETKPGPKTEEKMPEPPVTEEPEEDPEYKTEEKPEENIADTDADDEDFETVYADSAETGIKPEPAAPAVSRSQAADEDEEEGYETVYETVYAASAASASAEQSAAEAVSEPVSEPAPEAVSDISEPEPAPEIPGAAKITEAAEADEDEGFETVYETVYAASAASASAEQSAAEAVSEPVSEPAPEAVSDISEPKPAPEISGAAKITEAAETAEADEDEGFETVYETVYAPSAEKHGEPEAAAENAKESEAPKADKPEAKQPKTPEKAKKKEKPAKKKEKNERPAKAPEKDKDAKKSPKAKIIAAAAAAAAVTGAAAAVFAVVGANAYKNEGKVFNIYAWNYEFRDYFEKYFTAEKPYNDAGDYFANAPGKKYVDIGVKFNWNIVSDTDGKYQAALDKALENGGSLDADKRVDMFLVEADYVKKYANSEYSMDVSKIGVRKAGSEYQYTVSAATDAKGKIKGVSYQCCPSALMYRRSIAKDVLGTDDPVQVQEQLDSWEEFNIAAEKAKRKNYFMTASYADTYYAFSTNLETPWVDADNNVSVPQSIDIWTEQARSYLSKGYTSAVGSWSDEKFRQMYKSGRVMCFFGPAWYFSFCMENAQDPVKGCYGDWAICEGPQAHFWGGTWLFAADGTDNPSLAADVMNAFTLNDRVCSALIENENQFTNNKNVNNRFAKDPNYGNAFLGGQNDVAVFAEFTDRIKYDNITEYDVHLNEFMQDCMLDYCSGHSTKEEAMREFRRRVKEQYPSLVLQ